MRNPPRNQQPESLRNHAAQTGPPGAPFHGLPAGPSRKPRHRQQAAAELARSNGKVAQAGIRHR